MFLYKPCSCGARSTVKVLVHTYGPAILGARRNIFQYHNGPYLSARGRALDGARDSDSGCDLGRGRSSRCSGGAGGTAGSCPSGRARGALRCGSARLAGARCGAGRCPWCRRWLRPRLPSPRGGASWTGTRGWTTRRTWAGCDNDNDALAQRSAGRGGHGERSLARLARLDAPEVVVVHRFGGSDAFGRIQLQELLQQVDRVRREATTTTQHATVSARGQEAPIY
jgi:hypothetical protein